MGDSSWRSKLPKDSYQPNNWPTNNLQTTCGPLADTGQSRNAGQLYPIPLQWVTALGHLVRIAANFHHKTIGIVEIYPATRGAGDRTIGDRNPIGPQYFNGLIKRLGGNIKR